MACISGQAINIQLNVSDSRAGGPRGTTGPDSLIKQLKWNDARSRRGSIVNPKPMRAQHTQTRSQSRQLSWGLQTASGFSHQIASPIHPLFVQVPAAVFKVWEVAAALCNCVTPLTTLHFIVIGWSAHEMFMFLQNKLVRRAMTFLLLFIGLLCFTWFWIKPSPRLALLAPSHLHLMTW